MQPSCPGVYWLRLPLGQGTGTLSAGINGQSAGTWNVCGLEAKPNPQRHKEGPGEAARARAASDRSPTFQAVFLGDNFENVLCFLQKDPCDTNIGGAFGFGDCKGKRRLKQSSLWCWGVTASQAEPVGEGGTPRERAGTQPPEKTGSPILGGPWDGLTGVLRGARSHRGWQDSGAKRSHGCPAPHRPIARLPGWGQVSLQDLNEQPAIMSSHGPRILARKGSRYRLPRSKRAELPPQAAGTSPDQAPVQNKHPGPLLRAWHCPREVRARQ